METAPINLAEFERLAAEKREQGPWDCFAGGAGDEVTLRENEAAWSHWRLRPRVLNDVREVSTAAEVLGRPVSRPVLVEPVAYQRMAQPLLREELELTLGLCGCTAPSQLTRAHLRRASAASVYSV